MWDADIRAEVIERLRSLPGLKNEDIYKEVVHVIPYEEVQLVANPDSVLKSIRLANKPLIVILSATQREPRLLFRV